MAKIPFGILGGVQGRVGTVIGSSCCGVYYVRGVSAKKYPAPTDRQSAQRSRFGAARVFVDTMCDFVRTGYRTQAVGMHARNAAISYAVYNSLRQTSEGFEVDYPKVLVSKGVIEAVGTGRAEVAGQSVVFTWQKDADNLSGRNGDRALVMAYDADACKPLYDSEFRARRSGQRAVVEVPDDCLGHTLHLYLGFISEDGKVATDSAYLGSVVVTAESVAASDSAQVPQSSEASALPQQSGTSETSVQSEVLAVSEPEAVPGNPQSTGFSEEKNKWVSEIGKIVNPQSAEASEASCTSVTYELSEKPHPFKIVSVAAGSAASSRSAREFSRPSLLISRVRRRVGQCLWLLNGKSTRHVASLLMQCTPR
jgi:hypothetical protein